MQAGVLGSWVLRPCSDRRCRDANDGGWNLITRVGDLAVSIPVPRRMADALLPHLADNKPLPIPRVAVAAGALWVGPIEERDG